MRQNKGETVRFPLFAAEYTYRLSAQVYVNGSGRAVSAATSYCYCSRSERPPIIGYTGGYGLRPNRPYVLLSREGAGNGK